MDSQERMVRSISKNGEIIGEVPWASCSMDLQNKFNASGGRLATKEPVTGATVFVEADGFGLQSLADTGASVCESCKAIVNENDAWDGTPECEKCRNK